MTTRVDISKLEAISFLWEIGNLTYLLDKTQLEMYKAIHNNPEQKFIINCSRRLGKCRKEGSTVATPNGPVEIQNLKPGDKVYGYDGEGKISLTNIVAVEYMGEKDVVDLKVSGRTIESCTPDHRFLTSSYNCKSLKERKVKDFYKGVRIKRNFVKIPCGNVHVPDAYALGALLGDGCSKERGTSIKISSQDEIIPKKVANLIGAEFCYKNHHANYTWVLSSTPKATGSGNGKHSKKFKISYYDEWCKGKGAHEKLADWSIIDKWDRESCLNFIAGLIDTDGSVGVISNILTIQFGSQSHQLMEVFQKLVYKLWQYRVVIMKDKRTKYVNGPYYQLTIRNNLFSKQIIKELDQYIQLDRKKWKPEYSNLIENNSNKDYVGVKISESYKARTWDIQVDNKTSLYLTGDGLVTHNSYLLCLIAVEQSLKKSGSRTCYAAPSAKAVKNIIQPIVTQIIKDCPKELKPRWYAQEGKYKFPNGSVIDVAGADADRAENLRGTAMDLGIVDEAGYIDQLDYVVGDILMPQTMTTEGRILIASTPPRAPDHDFCQYVEAARQVGNYLHKTIHDNARITSKLVKKFMKETMTAEEREKYSEDDLNVFIKEKTGPKNTTWRREYMAEIVKDESSAIIPEFTDEKEAKVVKAIETPPFYDRYVAMDVGFEDNTAVLFAYWHFNEAKLVIEDELLINRMTTLDLANNIKAKEEALWNDSPVFSRVSDTDLILINDLQKLHNLVFSTVQKDNKEAAINNVRLMMADNQIIIHPRCVKLISQLKSGVWDKSGKGFQRSNLHGHFDLIDALLYLVRSIRRHKNPYPPGYQLDENTMYVPADAFKPKVSREIIKIFPPNMRK